MFGILLGMGLGYGAWWGLGKVCTYAILEAKKNKDNYDNVMNHPGNRVEYLQIPQIQYQQQPQPQEEEEEIIWHSVKMP